MLPPTDIEVGFLRRERAITKRISNTPKAIPPSMIGLSSISSMKLGGGGGGGGGTNFLTGGLAGAEATAPAGGTEATGAVATGAGAEAAAFCAAAACSAANLAAA